VEAKHIIFWNVTVFVGRLFMGVPKPTEMTIRDLLQEELRKKGVAQSFQSLVFPRLLSVKLDVI